MERKMLKENKHCISKMLKRDDNVQGEDRRKKGNEDPIDK